MRPAPAACAEGSCAGGGYPAFSFVRLSSPETASVSSVFPSMGLGDSPHLPKPYTAAHRGPHTRAFPASLLRALFGEIGLKASKLILAEEVQDANLEGHAMLQKFLDGLKYIPESLLTFRGQATAILELYLEPLNRRSVETYAAAYARYFADMQAAGEIFNADLFEQSSNFFFQLPMPTRFLRNFKFISVLINSSIHNKKDKKAQIILQPTRIFSD
jgi:hypothetical protein